MADTQPVQAPQGESPVGLFERALLLIPGIILTGIVAWLGIQSSEWVGTELLGFDKSPVSGIMMAIIIGLVIGNVVNLPPLFKPGITFSLKSLLKLGIILLGIRLSLGDVVEVGLVGLPVIILCVTGGLIVARALSKRLGLSDRLGTLIAIGTSICGATAIVATGPILDAKEEEITYAIANITVFGIIAMFAYPYLAHALFPTNDLGAGLFLGTAIHETAQVAGAGLIYSELYDNPDVLNTATVTKLVRNVFMIAVIPFMAYDYQKRRNLAEQKPLNLMTLFPMFILGFLLMAFFRTIGDATLDSGGNAFGLLDANVWKDVTDSIKQAAENLLAIAMAGVGLGTSLRQLRNLGIKPFYVGFASAVIVAGLSLSALFVLGLMGII
ncbi:MAG: putative sulfate exporter family transporter [Aggregatilineales bacterium]